MKKTILFFIALLFGFSLAGQSGGDGLTEGSAYYGTITTPTTWTYAYNSGTIYVGQTGGNEDLTIGTGGSLTIEAGVSIKFCTTSSDLRITGTGILTAVGTSASFITFTKNIQATWGHISFEASTGNSLINYCIIEFGYKNGSSIEGYGGGIHANTNNLSVTNSIIRNNYALWGGGVFVSQSMSPSFSNCYVYNNRSGDAGGGFYFWNGAKSVISNCIFDSNHCLEPSVSFYTGGGLAAQSGTSLKILNCTFVNNTSTQPAGKSIMLYSSSGDLVLNCIVWGNTGNQFYLTGTNTIQYTAVVVSAPAGTGNFVLSINNTDPAGPNFNNPAIADWSINFVSPCRDQGTTPSPAIPNDYAGNPRIGPYDIGAYEVQYSRWTGGASSTTWGTTGNWYLNMTPSTSSGVVIASATYNPTISASDITVANLVTETGGVLTVGTGRLLTSSSLKNSGSVIFNPQAKGTITTIVNSGTLKLESDGSGISSLINDSFSGSDATVELYLTGGGSVGSYKWHYISIPFTTTVPVSTFTGVTLDIASYNEPRVSSDVSQGWIGYDGWIYSTPEVDYDATYAFSNLVSGRGYEYWDNNNNKFTISGTLNTSDVSPTVTFKTGGIDAVNGFNLLGNPFPSGLDWDYIIAQGNFPANTSKSLYFTLDNQLASYIAGVGVPAGVNGFIPPMQGFMTKTYVENHTIVLAAAARTHSMHSRYKGKSSIPLVRLSIAEGTSADETVVRFDEFAKTILDNDFDAVKMSVSPENLLIYSSLGGVNYVINGQPFPETSLEIPILVNLKQDGNHSINTTELQGLDIYNVTLVDNTTGFAADLKTTPVLSFSANAGTITDRFILKVATLTTKVENPVVVSDNTFNIYSGNNNINIQTISDDWDGKSGSVRVLDLTGKAASDLQNVEFSKNSLVQVQSPGATGIYIVEIRSGVKRFVGKVVVR